MSIVGMWLTCTVQIWLYVPSLKMHMTHTGKVNCKVVDDTFMKVGTSGMLQQPMLVDCRKDIMWLNPKYTDGYFMFMKEDRECKR